MPTVARPWPTPPPLRVADLFATAGEASEGQPWVALGENPGRELVFGAVGKPWRASIERRRVEPEHFTSYDEAGWAKMAAAFMVHSYGTRRSLLTYEARTACTDPAATARFGRYWTLVSPGIGVVLRGALRAVRAAAEQVSWIACFGQTSMPSRASTMPLKPWKSTERKWSMRSPVFCSMVLMVQAAAPPMWCVGDLVTGPARGVGGMRQALCPRVRLPVPPGVAVRCAVS